MSGYPVGTTRTVDIRTEDANGIPAWGSAVRLYVRSPLGTVTIYDTTSTPAVQKPTGSDGLYQFDLLLSATGRWRWRWEVDGVGGSSAPTIVLEDYLDCARSMVRTDLR